MALVLKIRERRTDFLYLTLCISSGLHSGFSLPTFLSHASPWSTAKQRNISIQHQVSTCLWVYACLCMSLSARGCNWGLPLSPSLISTSTVPVCWHPAIHTQFSIWWENKMEGKKKKKIRQAKKSTENDYSCWGQADLTSNENTQEYPERHKYSTTHSVGWVHCAIPSTGFFESHRLCGGPSKHIFIQFHWKDLRLLREVVFEVISLCPCILYCAVMTWVTQ